MTKRRPRSQLELYGCRLVFLLGVLPAGCLDTEETPENLPAFSGSAYGIGALICVNGPAAANAPDLERAAILASEFVNGSSRAFLGQDPTSIECRQTGTCGVRVGRSTDGTPLRGRLVVQVANSEDRLDRALAAARRLVEQVDVIIGPCNPQIMSTVFEDVTGTDTLLISPVVTADAISDLPDRTAAEIDEQLPGWVYRTVVPDYLLTQTLGVAALNSISPPPFVRTTDRTDRECRTNEANACAEFGADYQCLIPNDVSVPEREFLDPTDVACAGPEDDSCDVFFDNAECREQPQGFRCQQFRTRRFCTRVPSPKTAMVLYPDTEDGELLRERLNEFWTNRQQLFVVAETVYGPDEPASFPTRLREMFRDAERNVATLKTNGQLEESYRFEDTVAFLFSEATEGALFLQEWSAQGGALGIEGAENVFWAGLNPLRSTLLTNQLPYQALRNLYVIDPAALDANTGPFFEDLYQRRWESAPTEFSANIFDAVLLVALAIERAAHEQAVAEPLGPLGAPDAVAVKNALPVVASGCRLTMLEEQCRDILGVVPEAISIRDYPSAVEAIAAGGNVRLIGSTGNLGFSPAGDRTGTVQLFKVEQDGERGRFFFLQGLTPQELGINLER